MEFGKSLTVKWSKNGVCIVKRVYIIAEAGVNHNGDINIAKRLVDAAQEAGADVVKFQTFQADSLVSKYAQKAKYQLQSTDEKETQREMLKKLELTYEMHVELLQYCREVGIDFLSTPFDLGSIDLLESVGMNLYKIPSGEITNLPYLRKIGSLRKPVILSSGMSTIGEVKEAVKVLRESGAANVAVLHCNTQYPTPMQDVNLNVMNTIRNEIGVSVGYSDHTEGIEVPIAAVAMGAEIIEKHFTLDKTMAGPDHKASLEPDGLKAMVQAIRNIEMAVGDIEKKPTRSEKDNIAVVRKSIVAKRQIEAGEMFSEDNITTKRPGIGISPMLWDNVVGTVAKRKYEEDELIEL